MTGRRLRREQWEQIGNGELGSEAMRMAERLREEMGSKLNRGGEQRKGFAERTGRDARRVGEFGRR